MPSAAHVLIGIGLMSGGVSVVGFQAGALVQAGEATGALPPGTSGLTQLVLYVLSAAGVLSLPGLWLKRRMDRAERNERDERAEIARLRHENTLLTGYANQAYARLQAADIEIPPPPASPPPTIIRP